MKEIIIYPSNHVTIIMDDQQETRLSPFQTKDIRRDFNIPEERKEDCPRTQMLSARGELANLVIFGTREHVSKIRYNKRK